MANEKWTPEWTPGPWVSTGYLVKNIDGKPVTYSCSHPESAKANSALIATAPEMYDILTEVLAHLKAQREAGVSGNECLLVEAIEDVLEKARIEVV